MQLILIGATADTASISSGPLLSVLQTQLGIAAPSYGSVGMMAFVAQKGMPEKAVYVSESGNNPNLYLNVQVQGNPYKILEYTV